ncbi:immunoglobulin A1 protease autotransporter-like [Salvia splendens]|uniref:immunoglobulin A1 protease autotransporter-like n=1 Tax=Salvia splendens TaxID=180675 RepID=UPI001C25844D|nr:immunoglobulin A1 protease autotransporter-like [Salvia splendens]
MGGVGTAPSEIPYAPVSHTAVHSEEGTPSATAPSETSVPNSAELDAVAAHYDSNPEEHEARTSQEQGDKEGSVEEHTAQKETVESLEESEQVVPPVIKPKAVKRKLVLKGDQKEVQPKPQRVSQRCLGKWAASKALASTVESPVEISSEEEQATHKKAEGKPTQATDQEDTGVSPVQNEQGAETEGVAEGPDLAPGSVRTEEADDVDAQAPGVTTLTAQEEEAQYQRARKRKGKAPIQKKSVTKRSRVANTGIVITEASQQTPPSRKELSDSEYAASEEPDSDSDISLEGEEYGEQSLPDDHRELVHPPVERLRYRRWTVDFTNEIAEEMKLFETQKLQDSFESLDDGSKEIKC